MQKKITISNIISEDMCTGCGSCLSALEQEAAMEWNEFGFLTPALKHSDIGDAIKYCPFNPYPEKEIENEDRLISSVDDLTDNLILDPLDYSAINTKLSTLQSESLSFIKNNV